VDRLVSFERGQLNAASDAIVAPPPVDHLKSQTWPTQDGLDKRGNWLTSNRSVERDGWVEDHTETRSRNGVNEYTSRRVDQGNLVVIAHDEAGNLLDAGGRYSFTYDASNRLVSVVDDVTQEDLLYVTYDALGRVIERTLSPIGGATQTIRYVYDAPGGPTGSGYAVLQEYDVTGTLLREFVHGSGHTRPVAMIDYTSLGWQPEGVAETFYYLQDERGSVTAITDPNGEVVESYRYDAYGGAYVYDGTGALIAAWNDPDLWDDTALTPSAIGNPYGFTGHRFSVAGLYETPFRAYSPYLGRWLQRDPIGHIDGLNLYAYVAGNPLRWLDLYGLARIVISIVNGNGPGSSGGSSSKRNYGHAWVDVYDDDGTRTGAGFYPGGEGAGKEAVTGRKYKPQYEDDTNTGHHFDSAFSFDVTQEQANKAKDAIKKHKKSRQKWSLNNNCTDFVCYVVEAAGIEIEKDQIKTSGWSDPAKLEDYLKEKEKEEEKKKPPSSGPSTAPGGQSGSDRASSSGSKGGCS
jgi:RHS repeat-associated protein